MGDFTGTTEDTGLSFRPIQQDQINAGDDRSTYLEWELEFIEEIALQIDASKTTGGVGSNTEVQSYGLCRITVIPTAGAYSSQNSSGFFKFRTSLPTGRRFRFEYTEVLLPVECTLFLYNGAAGTGDPIFERTGGDAIPASGSFGTPHMFVDGIAHGHTGIANHAEEYVYLGYSCGDSGAVNDWDFKFLFIEEQEEYEAEEKILQGSYPLIPKLPATSPIQLNIESDLDNAAGTTATMPRVYMSGFRTVRHNLQESDNGLHDSGAGGSATLAVADRLLLNTFKKMGNNHNKHKFFTVVSSAPHHRLRIEITHLTQQANRAAYWEVYDGTKDEVDLGTAPKLYRWENNTSNDSYRYYSKVVHGPWEYVDLNSKYRCWKSVIYTKPGVGTELSYATFDIFTGMGNQSEYMHSNILVDEERLVTSSGSFKDMNVSVPTAISNSGMSAFTSPNNSDVAPTPLVNTNGQYIDLESPTTLPQGLDAGVEYAVAMIIRAYEPGNKLRFIIEGLQSNSEDSGTCGNTLEIFDGDSHTDTKLFSIVTDGNSTYTQYMPDQYQTPATSRDTSIPASYNTSGRDMYIKFNMGAQAIASKGVHPSGYNPFMD